MFTNKVSNGAEDIEAGSSISLIEVSIAKKANGGLIDEHIVDIDRWADNLARIIEDVPQYMCISGHPGRISRLPENLREKDPKSYEPHFVSIGPYHHGKSQVRSMEKRKQLILKCVLKHKPELLLKDCLKVLKDTETIARSFYSDVDMESEQFITMLLLDSLFILNVFCGMPRSQVRLNMITEGITTMESEETGYDNENTVTTLRVEEWSDETWSGPNNLPRWFWILLEHDIFLIENQLPFFFLQKIHILAYGGSQNQLTHIMKTKIGMILVSYTQVDADKVISPTEEVHHLLHLCHMFFRSTVQQESTSELGVSDQMFRLGSAVQLYEAGVSFAARSGSSKHSLLDITFGGSENMSMPCLQVDDNTFSLLRNLIALEQMKYPSVGLNVSAYAVLLLHLVTIPEDVKLLRRKGIIQHHLASDKEMMYLVNNLSVGLAFDYSEDNYSLKQVFHELKRYSGRRVPRWSAWLKHRHCINPWTAISLMAASLLLILTALQTYYTVYSYYKPCLDCHS